MAMNNHPDDMQESEFAEDTDVESSISEADAAILADAIGEESDLPKIDFGDKAAMKAIHKKLKLLAADMDPPSVRALVDTYYMLQRDRIRHGNRMSAIQRGKDTTIDVEGVDDKDLNQPLPVLDVFLQELRAMEELCKVPLDAYSMSREDGRWLRAQKGIGPVLASTLLAHLDITKARTYGAFERYAGLDPTSVWNAGEKRPWNATVKKTVWLCGQSFVKVSNREGALYGQTYKAAKAREAIDNAAGLCSISAAAYLKGMVNLGNRQNKLPKNATPEEQEKAVNNQRAWTKTLSEGKLPPFLLEKRAIRKSTSLFISHLFHVMHHVHHGKPPAFMPYVFDIKGHAHYVAPPFWNNATGKTDLTVAAYPR
jgi:Transposase IS116/IS110/IS902 family